MFNTYTPVEQQMKTQVDQFSRNMVFQTNAANIIQPTVQQRQNELINAQYGASKYTASLVSGKMFKKIKLIILYFKLFNYL